MTDPHSPPPIPRSRPRDQVTTPPAQNGGKTNGACLGAPNGSARCVVEHSVYNWVELVYKAFGMEIPSDAKKVALLGVREATFADGAGLDAARLIEREKLAASTVGETRTTTATQNLQAVARGENRFKCDEKRFTCDEKGNPKKDWSNSTVRFDDMLYMVWTNEGQAIDQHVQVFRCSIDPGANESDLETTGTPLLLEGYPYKLRPTNHYATVEGARVLLDGALQIYSGTSPNIRVARDATKSKNVFTNISDAMLKGHRYNNNADWMFCSDEANPSIHMHWTLDYGADGMVQNWSTGCTVLAHSRASERYATDFRKPWEAAPNKNAIPYLVVSSKYLVMYDDWQAELRKSPGTKATVASVIKKEGIPLMSAGVLGRLPSIATDGFVKDVQAALKELDAGTCASAKGANQAVLAANLRTSLSNLGITTLTV